MSCNISKDPPVAKRPAVDDGTGDNPNKKPETGGPFDPAKKITPQE
jgi:hypothetical protein